jgi:RNA polymerase sigma-70 factor (ECF subfamily)
MNPLADPAPLIRRVYAYVAYRLGDGPDAEDVTSDAFERALRYRSSYDSRKGPPAAWLVGIARRAVDDHLSSHRPLTDAEVGERAAPRDIEADAVRRIALGAAIAKLDVRDRELVALRFGADLTARQIGELLGMRTNAVEVALHRALARLRAELGEEPSTALVRPAAAAGGV